MDEAIVDTDILSEVLKGKDAQVLVSAQRYLTVHQRLAFSSMTMYEIMRGMIANHATRQLATFVALTARSDVLPISTSVLKRAAQLWADARNSGQPRDDADLIIAATALEAQRVLVTGNTPHFSWIAGLRLEDWRSPKP
jgi:tRNA(fMet)-specific endonuclease VapC